MSAEFQAVRPEAGPGHRPYQVLGARSSSVAYPHRTQPQLPDASRSLGMRGRKQCPTDIPPRSDYWATSSYGFGSVGPPSMHSIEAGRFADLVMPERTTEHRKSKASEFR